MQKKLVRAFSEAVLDIIEQEPVRLREVTGIGPKRAERIIAGWADQKIIREMLVGERKALAIAMKGARAKRRWSKLREWLIDSGLPARRGSVVD
jgi:hypothetical protein